MGTQLDSDLPQLCFDCTGLWEGVREWGCGWAGPAECDTQAIPKCDLERPWLLDVACIFLLTLCIVACRKYTMWKAGKSRISCRSRCEPGQPRVALCWHIASNAPSSSEVEFRVVQIPGGCGELNTSKRVWCRRNLQTGEYQLRIPF